MRGAASGDHRLDAQSPHEPTVLVVVVAAVAEHHVRPPTRPPDQARNGRDLGEEGQQLRDVVLVRSGRGPASYSQVEPEVRGDPRCRGTPPTAAQGALRFRAPGPRSERYSPLASGLQRSAILPPAPGPRERSQTARETYVANMAIASDGRRKRATVGIALGRQESSEQDWNRAHPDGNLHTSDLSAASWWPSPLGDSPDPFRMPSIRCPRPLRDGGNERRYGVAVGRPRQRLDCPMSLPLRCWAFRRYPEAAGSAARPEGPCVGGESPGSDGWPGSEGCWLFNVDSPG